MIEITLYVSFVAFEMCLTVRIYFGKCGFTVTHSVRFDVSLSYHIDTVFVAKFIPVCIVRIVTSTDGVDIEFLHYLDILKHTFARNDITSVRVHFVTVSSLEQYRLTVDENLRVLDFHFSESYFYRYYFCHFITFLHASTQCIKIRSFCSPFVRVFNLEFCLNISATFHFFGRHYIVLCIEQFKSYTIIALHAENYIECSVLIFTVEVRSDTDIVYTALVAGIEIAVTSYSAITEEVLVFKICTVAPTEYLECNEVLLSRFQIFGNVKLCLKLAVLAVTYKLSIYPEIHV